MVHFGLDLIIIIIVIAIAIAIKIKFFFKSKCEQNIILINLSCNAFTNKSNKHC